MLRRKKYRHGLRGRRRSSRTRGSRRRTSIVAGEGGGHARRGAGAEHFVSIYVDWVLGLMLRYRLSSTRLIYRKHPPRYYSLAHSKINRFYPAKYHGVYNSIFALVDVCDMIPDESADVCILEEPEHLNWYRSPGECKKRHTLCENRIAGNNTGYFGGIHPEFRTSWPTFILPPSSFHRATRGRMHPLVRQIPSLHRNRPRPPPRAPYAYPRRIPRGAPPIGRAECCGGARQLPSHPRRFPGVPYRGRMYGERKWCPGGVFGGGTEETKMDVRGGAARSAAASSAA